MIVNYLPVLITLVAFVKEKATGKFNTEQSENRASDQVGVSNDKSSSSASTGYPMSESSKTFGSSSVPKNKRESTPSDKESFQENVTMMTDEDMKEFAAWILEKEGRDYIPPKGGKAREFIESDDGERQRFSDVKDDSTYDGHIKFEYLSNMSGYDLFKKGFVTLWFMTDYCDSVKAGAQMKGIGMYM